MSFINSFTIVNLKTSIAIVILSIFVSACGGGGSSDTSSSTTTPVANNIPTANAGADQTVSIGNTVNLSGGESSDADGDSLTYSWSFSSIPNGSAATLSSTSTEQSSFIADVEGVYVVSLTVNDGTADSTADLVSITAQSDQSNTAPVANAGADQTITTGNTVNLSGVESADADGDSLTYNWSFSSRPNGSTASLTSASSEQSSFIADVDGNYVVSLTVNDGTADSTADTVSITANSEQDGGAMSLASKAVKDNLILPLSATCDGADNGNSLSISWSGVPSNVQSYALTMHHYPNASDEGDLSKAKSYWTLYDIPASTTALATGQADIGIFGTNTVNNEQSYSAPCSQGVGEQEYTITLYALSSAVDSLGLVGSSTDIVVLTDAIASSTLETTTLTVQRSRYNPDNDDHVPASVPSDCASKSIAFDAYSDFVSVSCDSTTMTVTTNTFLPYRSALDGDKSNVGIKSWIGRVPIPEEASWTLPLQPNYLDETASNINIHHAIGVTVDGLPILHYAKENTSDEIAQLGQDYSDRDTVILGEIDQCGAHAGNGEDYHYHMAPLCMMDSHDPSQPLAYMFDGIPLYFGTGGGEASAGGTNYGAGRYTELNYLPQNVKTATRPLDECNAYDLNGDGSEYIYYTTTDAPYTIGCYRGVADQEGSVPTGDHWTQDRDLSWAGSDVELTDHDTMFFNDQTWFFIEITPGATNNNIADGDTALIMYRQLTSNDSDYDANANCYDFRYRLDSKDTDGSNDTEATHCR